MDNVTITMSHEDWNTITTYLLMTTNYRKDEIDSCQRLSEERDENGNPAFPKMKDNADFWKRMDDKLNKIREGIDTACMTPQIGQARLEELCTLLKDGMIQDDEEQAYIYFKDTCDMGFKEADFLGLEFDKWEQYNGESIFVEDNEMLIPTRFYVDYENAAQNVNSLKEAVALLKSAISTFDGKVVKFHGDYKHQSCDSYVGSPDNKWTFCFNLTETNAKADVARCIEDLTMAKYQLAGGEKYTYTPDFIDTVKKYAAKHYMKPANVDLSKHTKNRNGKEDR